MSTPTPSPRHARIAVQVIIASHNRRPLTEQAIDRALALASQYDVRVYLFDDGSTDGTREAVRSRGEAVHLIEGDGSAFWANSMARAESAALSDDEFIDGSAAAYIVWLNDDSHLDAGALESLLNTCRDFPDALVVGSMRDPDTNVVTYGGLVREGLHPLHFRTVMPASERIVNAEVMNGNLVVMRREVASVVGGIEGRFAHGMADIEYGLRASRLGFETVVAPGFFGTCPRNAPAVRAPFGRSWRSFLGPKGAGHPASLRLLLRAAAPKTWPVWWLTTYASWFLRSVRIRVSLRR